MKTYYIVSGGFDPIHEGHISMILDSAKKSDGVIILLNSDNWLRRKKGREFQKFDTRSCICAAIKNVIDVISFNDDDDSASDGLKKACEKYPNENLVFANGGDRKKENIRESETCLKYNIALEFGIGGDTKANSSSWILEKWQNKSNT